ncbi:hypothetical protein [Streptomyces formicae]
MKMTESYATTVAAVAPVVMLVAVVEISNKRARFRDLYGEQAEIDATVAALFADGASPSREQIAETERTLASLRARRGVRAMWGLYVYSACFVGMALLIAEATSLRWLASEDRGAAPFDALVCYVALGLGFAWAVITPIATLLGSVLPKAVLSVCAWRRLTRYSSLVRRCRLDAREDGGNSGHPPGA